jgi:hypothetical protein
MGYPELDQDEPVILESRNVKFKSISFDAILTKKRIILTGCKKNIIPAQEIALSTIKNFEAGENAIRDYFLILSLVNEAGEKHQTILTFSRQAGVERRRECNDWAKKLKTLIPLSIPAKAHADVPEVNGEPSTKRDVPVSEPEPAPKRKTDLTRQREPVIKKSPAAPEPGETSFLPPGSFCSHCRNRIPLKSTFCTYCGAPNKNLSGFGQKPQPGVAERQVSVPFREPEPADIKEQKIAQPPAGSAIECQTRPEETTSNSLEPRIRDPASGERHPLPEQKQTPQQHTEPFSAALHPGEQPKVIWAIIPPAESPVTLACETDPVEPEPLPPLTAHTSAGKTRYIAIGILMISLLPIIAGLVIIATSMTGSSPGMLTLPILPDIGTPLLQSALQLTTIPAATATGSPEPTRVIIPSRGVWVKASYPGTYTGSIGINGNRVEVTGKGENFYPVSPDDSVVTAFLQKKDESASEISLELYKNGVLVKREVNVTPGGSIEIQLDLRTV